MRLVPRVNTYRSNSLCFLCCKAIRNPESNENKLDKNLDLELIGDQA